MRQHRERILVLGGAGFLGSHLVDRIRREQPEGRIVVVDDLSSGRRENLRGDSSATILRCPVESVTGFYSGEFDQVYHLASPASPPRYMSRPIQTVMANVMGASLAVRVVRPGGLIFFASTSEVYGDPEVSPQSEAYPGRVSCTGPRAPYDEGKRATEAMLLNWARVQREGQTPHARTRLRIARIFNTYGPRMREDDGRVVSTFLAQALDGRDLTVHGDGTQTRSLCYVDDLIEGIWRLCHDAPEWLTGPMNIGNDEEISVLELARFVADDLFSHRLAMVDELPAMPDDPHRRRPDLYMARQYLSGWDPQVHWRDGVRRTLEWLIESRRGRDEDSGADVQATLER